MFDPEDPDFKLPENFKRKKFNRFLLASLHDQEGKEDEPDTDEENLRMQEKEYAIFQENKRQEAIRERTRKRKITYQKKLKKLKKKRTKEEDLKES